ncbi:YceD family protein [Elongatibacter sediminis]|uniref:Large ribosomal RNA subunit accumulation protein YceD n=1 Tax=Elongatibacter sediminis TaxID=3119006 RepID=A0AAW9R7D2_9GAMM
MSRDYPDQVDPWKAAEGRRTFSGTVPMDRMARLMPLLEPPVGEAEFTAQFRFDEERNAVIRIEVRAKLPMICQRSLKRYEESVQRRSLLGVITSADEESDLPGHYEPALAENGRIQLRDLVEDELLLGAPQVPRDPAVDAVRRSFGRSGSEQDEPPASSSDEPTRRPFADLAEQLARKQSGKPEEEQ